jgi:hypothetical protein
MQVTAVAVRLSSAIVRLGADPGTSASATPSRCEVIRLAERKRPANIQGVAGGERRLRDSPPPGLRESRPPPEPRGPGRHVGGYGNRRSGLQASSSRVGAGEAPQGRRAHPPSRTAGSI